MNWFSELRNQKNIKNRKIAEHCNKSEAAVEKWQKNDRGGPPDEVLPKLAELFNESESHLKELKYGTEGQANSQLKELVGALKQLVDLEVNVVGIAQRTFTHFDPNGSNPLHQIAHLILREISECGFTDFNVFFTTLLKEADDEESRLREDGKKYDALKNLIYAASCCYLDPDSIYFTSIIEPGEVVRVNLPGLEVQKSEPRKINLAALCFRLLHFQRFSAKDKLEIHMDLNSANFLIKGRNIPIPKPTGTDIEGQFRAFCEELGRHLQVEEPLPLNWEYCEEYLGALDGAMQQSDIDELNAWMLNKTGRSSHVLAFTCDREQPEIISRILSEFSVLPVYHYTSDGKNALTENARVVYPAIFLKEKLALLQSKVVRNKGLNAQIKESGGGKDTMNQKIKLFLSYAHKDNPLVEELLDMLSDKFAVAKGVEIEVWRDGKILMGEDWDAEIKKALDTCDFGLLMMSESFLASQYIKKVELPKLVREKKALPVALKKIDFANFDLRGLQAKQFFKWKTLSFRECDDSQREEFAYDLFGEIMTIIKSKGNNHVGE